MSIKTRLLDKAEIYVVSAILAPLALGGFYAIMDARHEPAGAVIEAEQKVLSTVQGVEVRALKRERRKLLNYQRLAPNSEYSASRQAEIDALKDEIEELENGQ